MSRNASMPGKASTQEGILCCQVVNFKQYGSIEVLDEIFGARWTYIGRANVYAGLPRSPLANPFKVGDFGGRQGATLSRYRRWLWGRIRAGDTAVIEALRAINETAVLVCWCAPAPCHGEVVRAAAAWLHGQEIP